jgi:hypothetical protein
MDSIPNSSVILQLLPEEQHSVPEWFAELVVVVETLRQQGALRALEEEVRLVRRRMGTFETIDLLAVLIGYGVSGMPTLESFFARTKPFGEVFMGLFGRNQLPSHAALSRFLAAMTPECVQSLRAVFERFSFRFGWTEQMLGGIIDRSGQRLQIFDVDGTRQVARQRRLPATGDLPPATRRLEKVCAVGYPGRKRGEVVRSRMTALHIHTHQWLFTQGGAGNGTPQEEVTLAQKKIAMYLQGFGLAESTALLRLDGQFGYPVFLRIWEQTTSFFVTRSIGYHLLQIPQVQAVLSLPPSAQVPGLSPDQPLDLFDVGDVDLDSQGLRVRVIILRRVAPKGRGRLSVGQRQGTWVYELFLTNVPATRLLAQDVLDVYRGRGGFENAFAAEDQETDPDRWCSHTPFGQECWQILAQWIWNLRQVLGQRLQEHPGRDIEWAPPAPIPAQVELAVEEAVTYGPWQLASSTRGASGKRLKASAFSLDPNGLVHCPQGASLVPQAALQQDTAFRQRQIWKANPKTCAACPLREACLGPEARSAAARSVSTIRLQLPPPAWVKPVSGFLPALRWQDVPARALRRRFLTHVRSQQVQVTTLPADPPQPIPRSPRAERSHQRLSWSQRLSRNAGPLPPRFHVSVSGIPARLVAG